MILWFLGFWVVLEKSWVDIPRVILGAKALVFFAIPLLMPKGHDGSRKWGHKIVLLGVGPPYLAKFVNITHKTRDYGRYGYGSIPINTIFRGMNIHLPAILMFTRGTRFWHTAIYRTRQFSVALGVAKDLLSRCPTLAGLPHWSWCLQQPLGRCRTWVMPLEYLISS